MIPVSDRWRANIGSFVEWRIRILVSRDGQSWHEAEMISGKVVEDTQAKVRFTFTGEIRVPDDSLVSTFGSQLKVSIQMVETGEWINKGHYRINTARRILGSTLWDVQATSYEDHLIDARLPTVRSLPSQAVKNTVRQLTSDVLPGIDIEFPSDAVANVRWPKMTVERDRWQAIDGSDPSTTQQGARSIAKAMGCQAYFDRDGVLRFRVPTSFSATPMWRVDIGGNGVEMASGELLDRSPIYNGVVAKGVPRQDGKGNKKVVGPVLVVDNDKSSATYWYKPISQGGFGKVPIFYSSPLLTTLAQCRSTALLFLRPRLGARRTIEFEQSFDPSKEAGDIGWAVGPRSRDEKVIIDRIDFDLAKRTMNVDCRASAMTEEGLMTVLTEGGDYGGEG